jgi:hypothetical protein
LEIQLKIHFSDVILIENVIKVKQIIHPGEKERLIEQDRRHTLSRDS